MSKAAKNSQKKADYEILFLDSPEYFVLRLGGRFNAAKPLLYAGTVG